MLNLFPKFASTLPLVNGNPQDPRLLLDSAQDLDIYYAPFDHVNTSARVVLVGLTPGRHQATVAIEAAAAALSQGKSLHDAARLAKNTASFSGPMKNNLIRLLNYFHANDWLGIEDCATLFGKNSDLVHYTSALHYPVFKSGKNYSGNPDILKTPLLRNILDTYLADELVGLKNAIFIPLGRPATDALVNLAAKGAIERHRILDGIPHPSGANAERIAYMLGGKAAHDLSAKTRADRIDSARTVLMRRMEALIIGH